MICTNISSLLYVHIPERHDASEFQLLGIVPEDVNLTFSGLKDSLFKELILLVFFNTAVDISISIQLTACLGYGFLKWGARKISSQDLWWLIRNCIRIHARKWK